MLTARRAVDDRCSIIRCRGLPYLSAMIEFVVSEDCARTAHVLSFYGFFIKRPSGNPRGPSEC